MYPHSQVLQDIYQTMPPFQTSLTVMCEISILHIYTKSASQTLVVSDLVTTISPNLLGLDGSNNRRKANGDPDNSALTGPGSGARMLMASGIWSSVAMTLLLLVSSLDARMMQHL
ncbi:uncharacterized protein LOC129747069 [Uranotaenia lowii]|uniref:uncharacterized protein LOC129747069 n=1 Tax=Uranotaenia lowii TaxID=190385 RepID=UPI002479AD26|nr:uncharacterized protein LOC129747069 [Uranotaenia lowii]